MAYSSVRPGSFWRCEVSRRFRLVMLMVVLSVLVISGLSACRKTQTAPAPLKAPEVQRAVLADNPSLVMPEIPKTRNGNPPLTVVYSFKAAGDEAEFAKVKAGLEKMDGVLQVDKVDNGMKVLFDMDILSPARVRVLIEGLAGDAEFARPNMCPSCAGKPDCSCADEPVKVVPRTGAPCDCAGQPDCPCS